MSRQQFFRAAVLALLAGACAGTLSFLPPPSLALAAPSEKKAFPPSQAPGGLLFVTLSSPDNSRTSQYLTDYAIFRLQKALARLPGVSKVTGIGGSGYGPHVWLDPKKLKAHSLNRKQVLEAIQRRQAAVAAGQVGEPPVPRGQTFQLVIQAPPSADALKNIPLKTDAKGNVVRLKDVAEIDFVVQGYESYAYLNGTPAVILVVHPGRGTRLQDVREAVRQQLARMEKNRPRGIEFKLALDGTAAPDGRPGFLLITPAVPKSNSAAEWPDRDGEQASQREKTLTALLRCDRFLRAVAGVKGRVILSENPLDPAHDSPCLLVAVGSAGREQSVKAVRARVERVTDLKLRVREVQ